MTDIAEFFLAALEHTYYLAPTDLGLTTDELIEAGKRHGFREGEMTDVLRVLSYRAPFSDGRFHPKADIGSPVGTFFFPMNPDYRPFPALDFVCAEFSELAREVGQAKARWGRGVLVERGVTKGLERQTLETAVSILLGSGYIGQEQGGTLALHSPAARVPSKELASGPRCQLSVDTVRRDLYPTIRDIIARRDDGRLPAIEPLDAFADLLEPLGYGPFRLWWKQTVDELRRSDENHNSVAVCVLAAAVVEGALIFIVRYARRLGAFASDNFDGPPQKWKLEKLVNSAASSGGNGAIFDPPLRARVEELISNRQRIHAGRMLDDYPKGVPDLKPEEARDAKRTADLAVRRIAEWVQAHPVKSETGVPT
jgi:hypothetical protein